MGQRSDAVVERVADWRHSGVSYYVHMGRLARMAGYFSLLAVGPAGACRSVVLGPGAAERAVLGLLAEIDLAARSDTAECLLALRDAVVC